RGRRSTGAGGPAGPRTPPTRRPARSRGRRSAGPGPRRCWAARCRRSTPACRPGPAPPPPPASPTWTRRPSAVVPVVDRPRQGRGRGQLGPPLGPQPLHVLLVGPGAVDPLVEPGVQGRRGAADPVPLQVEAVVAVVVALGVGRMGPPRADHHRVDLDPREPGPVGGGPPG